MKDWALGGFTLVLALAPIFNEGMYSYYAVPQKALFWAMAAWLCLLHLQDTGRRRWGVGAAVLAFISCGTYEIGYMYTVIVAGVFLVLSRSVKKALLRCAPALGGTAVALAFHLASSRGSGSTGNALAVNLPEIARVTVQQMAASIPFFNPMMLGEDPGVITNGDKLWPLLLGIVAGLVLCFVVPLRKVPARVPAAMAGLGLALWAGPALLLACSERYQQPEAITWKWGVHSRGGQFGRVCPCTGLPDCTAGRLSGTPAPLARRTAAPGAGGAGGGGHLCQRRLYPRLPAQPPCQESGQLLLLCGYH